jgi:hypothetical protein
MIGSKQAPGFLMTCTPISKVNLDSYPAACGSQVL